MRVFVGFERTGVVRDAFLAAGHEAVSCDLQETVAPGPHHKGDVFDVLAHPEKFFTGPIDLGILHPPCTYLCNAGVHHLTGRRATEDTTAGGGRWDDLREGAALFRAVWEAEIPRVAVENPIMHKYAIALTGAGKPTQYVHPWQFGHPEQKPTGLWLRNLPPLVPTDNVKAHMLTLPPAQRQRIWYASPGPERSNLRSATFPGIAAAMAEQWGAL